MNELKDISGIHLKVLILEDSENDFELIQELLSNAGYILNLTHVDNEVGYSTSLRENSFDIILSDFSLPGFDAFGALHIRNELCPEVPFICISGSIGEETAIDLLKLGAVDYVLKDRPVRLPFSVKRALDEAKENAAYLKAVKELEKSKLRFEQVAEEAQEWIWEVDENGLYTYASPIVQTLLGYTVEELVGKKYFYDLFIPEKREELKKATMNFLAKRESVRNFHNPNIHKDGHVLILSTSGGPLFDDGGNFIGFRGMDTDITERTKMMEELLHAKIKAEESDKLKTAFINNISHEIRTPVNSILGFGQLLSESELTEIERKVYFDIIQKSSNRLLNTVSDYIDMARIVTGTMEVHKTDFLMLPLFNEIYENTKPLCADKLIGFEIVLPSDASDLTLFSDRAIIQKIMHVLLDNALKFTEQGSIQCGYRCNSNDLEFFVKDTGCGIAPDKLEHIFYMFSQEDLSSNRGHEGSGLGLTIAKGFVNLLGGTMTVTSDKAKGSSFQFTIPYLVSNKVEVEPIQTNSTSTNKPLVLIAEDEESNFLYLEALLNMMNCDYIHASNGAEAVEICQQNNAINLILMDIKMPIMNGLEATDLIHEFRPNLPIIATTAYAQTGDEQRFLAAGCNGYLPKPIKKDILLQIIQKYTQQRT